MTTVRRLGIVGAGVMGRGIAQVAAEAGLPTLLADAHPGAAAAAKSFCAAMVDRKRAKGQIDAACATRTLDLISPVDLADTGYAGFADCDLVVEAVVERADVKQEVLRALEEVATDTCFIATNTSSLSITAIAAAARRPERVAGLHFFNPVPLMRLVEVIGGVRTAEAVLRDLTTFVERLGHRPVRAADTPGFLVNHAGRGYGLEALRVVAERVCTAHDVDRVMVEAAGFPLGPFALFDLVGLDVAKAVMDGIYHQFHEEPRYRPSLMVTQRVTAGLLGRKTEAGFYAYGATSDQPIEPPLPAVDAGARPYWVSAREPDAADDLRATLRAARLSVEQTERPSAEAVVLLTPFGLDCTTAARLQDIDPARCLAVDCLFGLAGRRTLMTNPATAPAIADMAHAALAADGAPVTRIADSCGFVAQRIAAMIVNTGCEIAQQGIAAPADIDVAVERGLGYRLGPLALGTRLGARRVLAILEAMGDIHRDPCYRPSLWLRRRAMLGVPLTTP